MEWVSVVDTGQWGRHWGYWCGHWGQKAGHWGYWDGTLRDSVVDTTDRG